MTRLHLILAFIILSTLVTQCVVNNSLRAKVGELGTNLRSQEILYEQKFQILTNGYGRLAARAEAAELTRDQIQRQVSMGNLSMLKQFDGLKKNLKNLESAVKVETVVKDSLTVILKDTTIMDKSAKIFAHKDEFMQAKGIVYDTLLHFDYSVMVPIEGAVFWERQHWKLFGKRRSWLPRLFGKKKYFNEFTSPNPNVSITGLQYIQVQKR